MPILPVPGQPGRFGATAERSNNRSDSEGQHGRQWKEPFRSRAWQAGTYSVVVDGIDKFCRSIQSQANIAERVCQIVDLLL
jgi:hypothetical protein